MCTSSQQLKHSSGWQIRRNWKSWAHSKLGTAERQLSTHQSPAEMESSVRSPSNKTTLLIRDTWRLAGPIVRRNIHGWEIQRAPVSRDGIIIFIRYVCTIHEANSRIVTFPHCDFFINFIYIFFLFSTEQRADSKWRRKHEIKTFFLSLFSIISPQAGSSM